MTDSGTPAAARPHRILELRVHGIKNTPPAEVLGVPQSELRQTQGDENGGFWWAPRSPEPDPDDPPGTLDPAVPPEDVRREAYSWGLLARFGAGPLLFIGQFFVQLAWPLLLPFGLANTAYWTRRIPDQHPGGEWRGGVGAGSLRIFALGLTLLYVCALGSISLDLGAQCLGPAAAAGAGPCPALPHAVTDFFTGPLAWRGRQLAVLSVVPIAGVLLLYVVARRARTRYEAAIFDTTDRMRRGARPEGPVRPLSSEGFWQTSRVGSPTEWLHLGATFFLVALLLAWDRLFADYGGSTDCAKLQTFVANGCALRAVEGGRWLFLLALLLGAAGLALTVVLVGVFSDTEDSGDRPVARFLAEKLHTRERTSLVLLWVGVLVYVLTIVALAVDGDYGEKTGPSGTAPAFLGLVTAPSLILGVLVAIAISALSWRRGVPHALSIVIMAVAGTSFLIAVALGPTRLDEAARPARAAFFVIAAAALVIELALIALWPRLTRDPIPHRVEGWGGTGPGVIMLLALGAAMILSTLLVLGTQAWLGTGAPACGCVTPVTAALRPPIAYQNFGDVLPLIAIVLAVVAGVVFFLRTRWVPMLTTPPTRGGRRPIVSPVSQYPDGIVQRADTQDRLALKILRARRQAALFHRGEPILGLLAALLAAGFVAALAVSYTDVYRWIDSFVGPVLGIIAIGVLVVIVENAITAKERPISVMWDLMCFLPRAGHPFAPPCYAERAVPELRDRVVDWLGHDLVPPAGLDPAERLRWREDVDDQVLRQERPYKVVVSAHSLGAVLAVACLFTLRPGDASRIANVGLLTYGTQLRVYFGRFFPELFGPRVLGTLPQLPPSLAQADPWYSQVQTDQLGSPPTFPPSRATDPTLVELLTQPEGRGVAWFSLWRRTDYLGFPVNSNAPNAIDRGADEFGPPRYLIKVATHPDYPSSPQYAAALRELIDRLG